MFDLSVQETEEIDLKLSPKLALAAKGQVAAEQLALDATRLLSCTEDRLNDFKDKHFFQRCWFKLTGKSESVQNATQKDLIEMQKYAWRYINLLQERDLMLADTMISIKNNLITLSIEQDEVKKQVNRLADKVYNRVVALEKRVDNIEISQRLHSWILTLDTYDYEELYPTYIRLLRVIKDFYEIKSDNWTIQELKYLQKALKESGIQPKEQILISDFINFIIDEVGDYYSDFDKFLSLNVDNNSNLVIEEVSSPTFISLYQVKDNYLYNSKTIKILSKKLKISEKEAIKEVLLSNITDLGLDIQASLPIKDLAIEILCCLRIMNKLNQETTDILTDGFENEQIDDDSGNKQADANSNIENELIDSNSENEKVDVDTGLESKFFAINEQEISKELIIDLVNHKVDFRVFNITDITATVAFLEKIIESQKFSVRVYTENRSAILAGGLIPTGVTQLAALGAGIGFAIHNLATFNPDFEIGKSVGMDRITVTYKKSR